MGNINVPNSMCKKILNLSGCRSTPETLKKYKADLIVREEAYVKSIGERVLADKRKTINPEDL
jgi:hypothetical protein